MTAHRQRAPALALAVPPRRRVHKPKPVPDVASLPGEALLTPAQIEALSGYSRQALKKWRREGIGRGPAVVYVEGRPRTTVAAYRAWAGLAR